MIINMAGGSGAGLNFTVVGGTTQLSTASENTIWVNSSTPVSSYVFSATEPATPIDDGTVWIQTGIKSNAAFNALKKNQLMVYPSACKQYENGAWQSKVAKCWMNGEWVDLYVALNIVLNGKHDTTDIGGWTASSKAFASGFVAKAPTITSTSAKLSLSISSSDYNNYAGGAISKNDIDFTNYSKITFVGTYTAGYGSKLSVAVIDRTSTYLHTNSKAYVLALNKNAEANSAGNFSVTLDVSDISGEYALAIGIAVQNINSFSATVTKLVIE